MGPFIGAAVAAGVVMYMIAPKDITVGVIISIQTHR
jgi:hypothetical protein